MENKGLQFYHSVMKQKQELNISVSIIQNWKDNEWLLKEMCETLNGETVYVMTEFCEHMELGQCGIFNISVTEEELNNYFYEDRKVNL